MKIIITYDQLINEIADNFFKQCPKWKIAKIIPIDDNGWADFSKDEIDFVSNGFKVIYKQPTPAQARKLLKVNDLVSKPENITDNEALTVVQDHLLFSREIDLDINSTDFNLTENLVTGTFSINSISQEGKIVNEDLTDFDGTVRNLMVTKNDIPFINTKKYVKDCLKAIKSRSKEFYRNYK